MPPLPTLPAGSALATAFDAELPWTVHPQVSLRPEAFGALAYHFETRRLSFLKSPVLVSVVEGLAGQPSARDAVRAAGVPDDQSERYERALAALAESGMICPREGR